MKTKRTRLTRRAYRRKLVMFGVSIFASVALTATGFAAWVLSSDSKQGENGSIHVGAVEDSTVSISNIEFVEGALDSEGNVIESFMFEPEKDDVDGRVIWNVDKPDQFENLGVAIQWDIVNYENAGKVYVEFVIPVTVKNAIDKGYIQLADEKWTLSETAVDATVFENGSEATKNGYVATYVIQNDLAAAKTGENSEGSLSWKVTETAGVKTATFTLQIAFEWGAHFGNENPSVAYDSDTTVKNALNEEKSGESLTNAEVKAELNKFRAMVHGVDYSELDGKSEAEIEELFEDKTVSYYLVINAKVA